MKKFFVLLTIITALLIACNTGTQTNNLLSKPGDVKTEEYTIDINRDTTLQTKNGALLKIPKGSLSIDNGTLVTLEIKEAYSMEQMILAGLTTQSDGEPLSSGGMIYINAKAGQNVTIRQAIKVAIPTNYLADSMQLFKGETMADGSINWKEPVALPENKQLSAIDEGKILFQKSCSSCHEIGKELTGPDLAHYLKRFPFGKNFPGYYLHYPYRLGYMMDTIAAKDSNIQVNGDIVYPQDKVDFYWCNMMNWSPAMGQIFNNLSIAQVNSIYKYIQNESDKRNLPLPKHAYLYDCIDSCIQYNKIVNKLKDEKQLIQTKREKPIDESPTLTEEIKIKTGSAPEPPVNFDNLVSPTNNKGIYYQFTIETFGWYNLDVLLEEVNGNQKSELTVRVVGEYREKLDIFLIIPSSKTYTKAGKKNNTADEYAFAYKDGTIFLPQNAKAYIMAVSETESSVAYELKEFTTSTKQEIEVALKTASKEEFNTAIQAISGNGITIKVADAKNANEIRKANTDLKVIEEELKKAEKLKPKNCDCDCRWPAKDNAVTPK